MQQLVYSAKSLGTEITRARKAKGLNHFEAGSTCKLDPNTVSSIELGAPATKIETIFRLLAALDLEMVIKPKASKDQR